MAPRRRSGLTFRVEVEGLPEALRAFSRFGRDANNELRDAAQAHARRLVPRLSAAAAARGGQAKAVAVSIRAPRDRVPVIAAGGSKRADVGRARRKPPSGDLVFGSEFGGGARPTSRQFPPHTPEGRWLYPTLRASVDELFRDYQATLADLARDWARGG